MEYELNRAAMVYISEIVVIIAKIRNLSIITETLKKSFFMLTWS